VSAHAWDALLIGAGPAGCALARRLAPLLRVCVLERAGSPAPAQGAAESDDLDAHGHRPPWRIGESLPGAAAVLLRRLGLFERFLADGHAERGASVSTWDSDTPVWFDTLRDPNGPGWHLDRLRFDGLLRAAAEESGAAFAPLHRGWRAAPDGSAWRVHDATTGEVHRAPVLVDATGRSAALCRRLDIPRKRSDRLVCLSLHLPADPDPDPRRFDRCTRTCADADGWWYSVCLPSGARVLALHLDADDPALRSLREADALLHHARRLPLLAEVLPARLPAAVQGLKVRVHPAGSAALDFDACLEHPGLFAVGDAALAFDPLSSQGLFHALASAESAASAILRHLDGDAAAAESTFTELARVHERYRAHLAASYAGPVRHAGRRFWSRRRAAAPRQPPPSPETARR
jgi:flavin-dependent dehydrogenase